MIPRWLYVQYSKVRGQLFYEFVQIIDQFSLIVKFFGQFNLNIT
jgi:hypothetical protein